MKKVVTLHMQGIVVQIEGTQAETDAALAKNCCDLGEAVLNEIKERQRIEQLAERVTGQPSSLTPLRPMV